MSQGVGRDRPDRDGPTHDPKTIDKFFKTRPSWVRRHLFLELA